MTTAEKIADLQRQARIETRNVEIASTSLGRKGAALRLSNIQIMLWNLMEEGA